MGSNPPINSSPNPILTAKLIESEPGLQIYQNPSGQEFQRYTLPCKPLAETTYQFRIFNHHPHLVDVLHAGTTCINLEQPKGFTCNSMPNILVVTERIPYRFLHLPPQYPHNALVILRCSLLGFHALFKVHGILCVRDTMIGLTSQNKVKVWLNPNFSINQPEPTPVSFKTLDPALHESEMVNNIFDLINSKAENSSIWRSLMLEREKRGNLGFVEGIAMVEQFMEREQIEFREEVRNPFNKMGREGMSSSSREGMRIGGAREECRSEIDKLEEVRQRDVVVERGELERARGHAIGSDLISNVRSSSQILDLKNRIVNPRVPTNEGNNQFNSQLQIVAGPIRQQQQQFQIQPSQAPRKPFQPLERSQQQQSKIEGGSSPQPVRSGSAQLHHQHNMVVSSNRRPLHYSPAPGHSHPLVAAVGQPRQAVSVGKPIEVKFRQQGPPPLPLAPLQPFHSQQGPPQMQANVRFNPIQQMRPIFPQQQPLQQSIPSRSVSESNSQQNTATIVDLPVEEQKQKVIRDVGKDRTDQNQTIIDDLADSKQTEKEAGVAVGGQGQGQQQGGPNSIVQLTQQSYHVQPVRLANHINHVQQQGNPIQHRQIQPMQSIQQMHVQQPLQSMQEFPPRQMQPFATLQQQHTLPSLHKQHTSPHPYHPHPHPIHINSIQTQQLVQSIEMPDSNKQIGTATFINHEEGFHTPPILTKHKVEKEDAEYSEVVNSQAKSQPENDDLQPSSEAGEEGQKQEEEGQKREGQHQSFFNMRQAESFATEGSIINPLLRNQGSSEQQVQATGQSKKEIQHLDKIEELHLHVGLTDSQQLKFPSKIPQHQLKEGPQQNATSAQPTTTSITISKPKLPKLSYKQMRKLLLQTMQTP